MNMKNSKQDWDDEILDENLQSQTFSDSKLTQSQSLKPIQINHPTKKFYKKLIKEYLSIKIQQLKSKSKDINCIIQILTMINVPFYFFYKILELRCH